MAHWIGAQGQVKVVKYAKTCPHCDVTKENPKPKSNNVFFQSEPEDLSNP